MAGSRYILESYRKVSWSFVGVVLALILASFTIYTEFLRDTYPHLQYDILTSTPVLDVREEVSKLDVLLNHF